MGTIVEPKLQSLINKYNMIGINIIEHNSWALVYEKGGYYGFIDAISNNNGVGLKYSHIELVEHFVICYLKGNGRKREVISVYTKGNKKNIMGRNTHTLIRNHSSLTEDNSKVMMIANLASRIEEGQYSVFLINYAGKRINLENFREQSCFLKSAGINDNYQQIFDLMTGYFGESRLLLMITEDLEIKATDEYYSYLRSFRDMIDQMNMRKRNNN